MNISGWTGPQIMQLPDNLFGSRYLISNFHGPSAAATSRAQSQLSLPERCVIWAVYLTARQTDAVAFKLGLRLGTDLVEGTTPWANLDRLFRSSVTPMQSYDFWGPMDAEFILGDLREYVEPAGQKLQTLVGFLGGSGYAECGTGIIVSSVPTEVPDWTLR